MGNTYKMTPHQTVPYISIFESLANVTPTSGFILDHIGHFCVLSYQIGCNPLPYLRKRYPEFNWKLINDEYGYSDFLEQIKGVDFVWSIGQRDHVIAIHKEKSWKGVRAFWSDEYTIREHERTYADAIHDLKELGFGMFGTLKEIETTS